MHLIKCGIIKREVYDDINIQRALNEGLVSEEVNLKWLDWFVDRGVIKSLLTEKDFNYLQSNGFLKESICFEEGTIVSEDGKRIDPDLNQPQCREELKKLALGSRLKHGRIIHGGFFMGPQEFYEYLKTMDVENRKKINMKSVRKINHLYGHEEIDRLHRKNARFINTCLFYTLNGSAVSDGLEDGKVISGVGGQYNFVSMAQELPDGHSILQLRSTRTSKGKLSSNIIWNYGHITIPRHLRDIVVSEYGIAFLRGKTDEEIIKELLNIADSRFQKELLEKSKDSGKLSEDYEIPKEFLNNYPDSYQSILKPLKEKDLFPKFPFGTDFSEEDINLGKSLKFLKAQTASAKGMLKLLAGILFDAKLNEATRPYLERMQLLNVSGLKGKLYRRMVSWALNECLKKP